ncbi:MAG: aldehyde dehydrogenase family protein [Acidobacteriia bacterium]|nr:aldehyde dehydrogenase family protein [Terriglobia bacterium]
MAKASVSLTTYKNFIAGEWVESKSARRVANVNPANTEEILGEIVLSTREETRAAVEAAEKALPAWSETPAPVRGKIITKAAQLMEARKEELSRALTLEEGKTLAESRGELARGINCVDFAASEGRRLKGETIPSELPSNFCYTLRQPIGVVACITPWNFPICIPAWKIAPALVCGNTVVFKPATLTPWTATLLTEIFVEAGVPAGVLNLVLGGGGEVGDELVTNEKIRAISFTGSNEIGTKLYQQGAQRGIKCQCEMGGKNPILVLADADLALAAESTVTGAFGSTGQRCTATSRAIVVESIADEFLNLLLERAKKIVVGNGLETGTVMGPAVDKNQYETVLKYIEIGRKEGAELKLGGHPVKGEKHSNGYFVEPTIFDQVRPTMRIAQEEIFGPVLSLIRVKDFEEGLAVANGVKFGLSSAIYTNDASKIFRFIDRIETGITHVNSGTPGGEAQLPFGGIKATGVGAREMGSSAIEFWSELKTVYIDFTGRRREGNLY